jgi:hypothetical protein
VSLLVRIRREKRVYFRLFKTQIKKREIYWKIAENNLILWEREKNLC